MIHPRQHVLGMARALSLLAGLVLACATPPAAAAELRLLLDADNNAVSGCTVAAPSGSFTGVEQLFITTVDTTTAPPRVTAVTRQDCVNPATGAFGPPSVVSGGGWNVGVGDGTGGSNVIETSLPYPPGAVAVRLGVVYDDPAIGADGLVVTSTGGPIIVSAVAIPDPNKIPTLSSTMLAVLVALLGVAAYVHMRRHGLPAAPLAIVVFVMVSTMTWAAIVLDGLVGDWAGTAPTATDPTGDAPNGSDIVALFTRVEGGTMFVRVDTLTGLPPLAADDGYTATPGVTLAVPAPSGLLANDARGTPAAVAVSFGGGSLGGLVTGHAVGSTASFGSGGSLAVFADGSMSFTPAAGFTGSFTFNYRITNLNGSSDATVTIAAREAPLFTSAASTAFTVGSAGTFAMTASGSPPPAFTVSGALPSGVTFNATTGVLSGTPAGGTAGTYPLTLTAANGVSPNATQAFTLTVNQSVAITSAAATTFATGTAGTFTITTTGIPAAATITATGALPAGVSFTNNGNGTATLAGTPGPGTGGTYAIALSASNGVGAPASQGFTLTVNQPPAITSANAATFVAGTPGAFTVTTTGFPRPAITQGGSLPAGVTFTDNGNGTATLGGIATGAGPYPIVLTAANGVGANAAQAFTITVDQSPTITSGNAATFTVGALGTFSVTTSATPVAATITQGGALPAGVTFTNNGNGTATLAGTPGPGTGGTYALAIAASNGVGANGVQSFTLTVNQAPAITSAPGAVFVAGQANGFTVTSTGFPVAALSAGGALPAGVGFVDNGNGTATLAGNPASGTGGTYSLVLSSINGVAPAFSQAFTLTVQQGPGAVADAYGVAHDTTLTVAAPGVLANDTGVPAPGLVSVTGSGAPCAAFPCAIATAQGSANVNADGSFAYMPAASFAGSDGFSYVIGNVVGTSAAAVSITVTNAAPVVDLDGPAGGIDFGPVTFTEGSGPVAIVDAAQLTLTDADGTQLADAKVTIANPLDGAAESIAVACPDPGPGCSGAILAADVTYTPATATLAIARVAPLADYQALLRTLTYGNASLNPDTSASRDITVTVNDGIENNSPLAHAVVAVSAVNNAPTITAPASVLTPSNTAFTFAGTVSVADPDAGSGAVQVVLTSTNGTATLSGTAGLTVLGNGTASVTSTGPIASQNAALNAMSFTPAAAYSGPASLKVDIDDQGNTGSGGPKTATRTVAITVDNPPSVTGTLPAAGAAAVATISTITVSFSEPVNATTASFALECPVGTPKTFALSPSPSASFVLVPTASLPEGISCRVTVIANQVTDSVGQNLAANYVTSFTTNSLPTVTATVPVNGATAVNPASALTVSFSEAVNATAASFTLQCPSGTPKAFTLSASPAASFTLTPSAALPAGTLCAATVVAAQVTDVDAGQNMAANFPFGFTTGTAPAITSASSATFTVGAAGSFTVTTTGAPSGASMSITSDPLPAGLALTNNNDGTATLAGTPGPGTGGQYTLSINAGNGIAPNATQSFTLRVQQPAAITSANNATFTINQAGVFVVTATGIPTGTFMNFAVGGALPTGVTLTNTGTGSAILGGTPTVSGVFPITIFANNGVPPAASQSFTLTVNAPPAITSASAATFKVGTAGSFTVTTTGTPSGASMSITSDPLPAGLALTNNNNGTATLAGTPGPGTGGQYTLSINASNGIAPNATQSFTLTVQQPAAITSANNATFTVNQAGTFVVTATGIPTGTFMNFAVGGALPTGVTLTNTGTGSAILGGTPTVSGVFPITIFANNGVPPAASQSFTLTVNGPPAITSANAATFKVGTAGSLTVTTTGTPSGASMSITELGALPSGVTFTNNNDGTATIAGTPAAATGGTYPIAITASNGIAPAATQNITLTVQQVPVITSANNATFTAGQVGTFTVTTTGFPTNASMSITELGALPAGVTFTNNNNGTATLAGTPTASGAFPITITANNGVAPNATQSFTLTVNAPPAITSANAATFVVGMANTFSVATSGSPTVSSIVRGGVALPSGVSFSYTGGASGTLSGTPPTSAAVGTYALSFTASNGIAPDAVQNPFTLTVSCPVIVVSPATLPNSFVGDPYGPVTFSAAGGSGSYTFTLGAGSPPGLAFTGADLGGTPTDTGTFTFAVTATDNATGCAGLRTYTNVQFDLIANNDSYGNIVGNVLVDSSGAPFSVVDNDQYPVGATITAFDATSVHGGTVTMITSGATLGQFTYNPPRGYVGPDSFTYTLAKNSRSATGTVSFNVSQMAWFVNNTAGACAASCDGRMTNPYTLLSNFAAANTGAAPAPQNNDIVFVYTGTGAYTGATTLRPGQRLIGQGAGSPLATLGGLTPGAGQTLPATGGTNPNINAPLTFVTGNSLQGFDMDGANASLTATAATGFAVNLGRFRRTGTTGNAILLSGAGNSGTYSFRSITATGIAGSANRGVAIQNLTGSFSVLGTDAGVSPNGGSITGFGGNGMDFRSVATCTPLGSCTGTAVVLNAVGVSGNGISQAVAGNNASCGGAITTGTNTSCVANLYLQDVDGATITGSTFSNGGQIGINGNNVYDFSLSTSSVQANGNEAAESGILFQNMHGASSIANSTVNGNAASQVVVGMTSPGSAPLTLTVNAGNFANAAAGANTASGFVLAGAASGPTTLNITGSSFANNGGGSALDLTAGTATAPLNLNGQVSSSTFASSQNGVILQANSTSSVSFDTVNNTMFKTMALQSILYQTNATASGLVQGRITGNTIGDPVTPGSACQPALPAPANCGGIFVDHEGGSSTLQVNVQGNTIQEIRGSYGISARGFGAGSAQTRVFGNTLRLPRGDVNQLEAIDINFATGTPSTLLVCADVRSNSISSAGGSTTWGAWLIPIFGTSIDVHLRQRNTVNVSLPTYAGAPTDTTAVQNFVTANNGLASSLAEVDFTATGFTGSAGCTVP